MNTFHNFDSNITNKSQKMTIMKKLIHIVLFFTTILFLRSCAMNEKLVNPFPVTAKFATIMRGIPDSIPQRSISIELAMNLHYLSDLDIKTPYIKIFSLQAYFSIMLMASVYTVIC